MRDRFHVKHREGEGALLRFLRGFLWAGRGLVWLFRTQRNFRVHLTILVAVLAAGILGGLAAWEWVAVALAAGLVLAAEAFNSALEAALDLTWGERPHPLAAAAKDAAAAGVLLAALAAVAVGLLLFGPRLRALLSSP